MKRIFWLSLGIVWLLPALVAAQAPSLVGNWQGVENDTGDPDGFWPVVLRLQKGKGSGLFGVLYQEVGTNPGVSVTFQMRGIPTATALRLEHVQILTETGFTPSNVWCAGVINFTYDGKLEKLTGRAAYRPVAECSVGTYTLYRIKLKSAETVPAGVRTAILVSGRNVRWYADAELKQYLATGNSYQIPLSKTTTFYLQQGAYLTKESPVVPITVRVGAPRPAPVQALPPPVPVPVAPTPAPAPLLPAEPAPVLLPTVLFKLGQAELLPEGAPALAQLATELNARPTLRLRIAGHTDRVGESDKNQLLSEQRAAAVKESLTQVGIAPERLDIVGYGDARPLYPSPDVRNRRVEVLEIK